MKYTINDIEEIRNNNYNYVICNDIIEIIKKIADTVGSNNYVKTPVFKKDVKQKKFKTTIMTNNNNIINNIKLILNKISSCNYNQHYNNIYDIIIKNEDLRQDIYITILKETIKNKINQSIFVLVIKLLNEQFDWAKPLYYNFIEEKYKDICEFNFSSSDNYELFCKVNSENEERKLFLKFIALIYKNDMIDINIINKIIDDFIELFYFNLDSDKYYIIEELSNCLVIILTDNYLILNSDKKNKVNKFVDLIINSDNKKYKGLTNKTIFKILDFKEKVLNNI